MRPPAATRWAHARSEAATALVVWVVVLGLVGVLTVAGVVVILPLYYRDRWKARRSHQGEGTCKAST